GFEIEPDRFQTESMTVTLAGPGITTPTSITENVNGFAGAQFFGFVGAGVTSVTITDNAGDDFAVGNFFVQKTLGIDYRLSSSAKTDPLLPSLTEGNGINFVGEYLGGDSSYLTAAKASKLISQGEQIFSIYEKGASVKDPTYFSGTGVNSTSY